MAALTQTTKIVDIYLKPLARTQVMDLTADSEHLILHRVNTIYIYLNITYTIRKVRTNKVNVKQGQIRALSVKYVLALFYAVEVAVACTWLTTWSRIMCYL